MEDEDKRQPISKNTQKEKTMECEGSKVKEEE